MKRITVKDVAKASGYSISTVSKALTGTDRIGKKTADKIRRIAKNLGYRTSISAQFVAGKRRKIAVILFESPPQVSNLFMHGFTAAFDMYGEFGIKPEYYIFGDARPQIPWQKITDSCDGAIITPSEELKPYSDQIEELSGHMPIVLLQTKYSFSDKLSPLSNVTVDAYTVGAMAAQFLYFICGPGTKTAIIAGYKDAWIHTENRNGFIQTAEKLPLYALDGGECFDDMQLTYKRTAELIDKHPELNGIFVTSYTAAAVCRCLSDLRQNSIKVVGVDLFKDTAECLRTGTLCATVFQNQAEQAQTAVHVLIDSMRGAEVKKDIAIKPELIMASNLDCYRI